MMGFLSDRGLARGERTQRAQPAQPTETGKPKNRGDWPWLDGAVSAVVGGILAGWMFALVDAAARNSWADVDRSQHVTLVAMMFAALGVVAGAGMALVSLSLAVVHGRVRTRWAVLGSCVVAGLIAALAADGPVRAALSGLAERDEATATQLIRVTHGAVIVGTAVLAAVAQWAVASSVRRRAVAAPIAFGVALLAVATGLGWADLTVMPALYAQVHETVEITAWAVGALGAGVAVFALVRRWRPVAWSLRVAALVAVAGSVLWFSGDGMLENSALRHIRREPNYVGRMMLRLTLARDYLENPTAWRGSQDAQLARLIKRYDIATVELSTAWDLPRPATELPPPAASATNVIVVFVDTLRADVASDASVMPNLARFRGEAVTFDRAYATASDTVSSLPVLTGGCYTPDGCRGDLLTVAKTAGVPSVIAIPKSARRFLAKHAPRFQFEEVMEITDYDEGKPVWGYGADQTTADEISRQNLAWIDAHPGQRFFMWGFHFDVHNWLQLKQDHLREVAARHGIEPSEADKTWRYRAAAAGVDEGLGLLLEGLKERGRDADTAVLVVADHGEALGHQGHWQHAVYLWDSLVHVPMVLRVPHVAPSAHDGPVGHVDVAPTLARLIDPRADMRLYHGVDLLAAAPPSDALPILLFSMRKDDLLRIGLVSRDAPFFKLELPIDSVEPDLFDLAAAHPDDVEVRDQNRTRTLELLSQLVTSPVFPRAEPEDPAQVATR